MLRKGKQYASGGYMVRGTASLAVVLFWCGLLAGQPSPQRVASGAAEPAGQMVNRLAGWQAGWLAGWLAGSLTGWLAGWLGKRARVLLC